eukprot:636048-Prymnesium_polylepis.3
MHHADGGREAERVRDHVRVEVGHRSEALRRGGAAWAWARRGRGAVWARRGREMGMEMGMEVGVEVGEKVGVEVGVEVDVRWASGGCGVGMWRGAAPASRRIGS